MEHRIDLHIHSCYSRLDGMMSPRAIVKLADKLGYDGLAVTDHYTYDGALRGTIATQRLAKERGLTAWKGLEYHVRNGDTRGHVLLHFRHSDQVPPRDLTLPELLDHAHGEDLTVTHPHPYGYGGIQDKALMRAADYIEISGSYGEGKVNDKLLDLAKKQGIEHKLVGNTDAHARGQMGSAYTTTAALSDDLQDTLATKTGHGLEDPRRSWGRAAKIARMVAQPVGLAMNGVQRLVTRWAVNQLPDPDLDPVPALREA